MKTRIYSVHDPIEKSKAENDINNLCSQEALKIISVSLTASQYTTTAIYILDNKENI